MHRVMLCFACGCLGMVGNRAGASVSDAAQDCLVAAPLADVKMLGYAGRKTDAFLAHRVRTSSRRSTAGGRSASRSKPRNDIIPQMDLGGIRND